MKNHWIKRRDEKWRKGYVIKGGFPQDDELTLHQWSGGEANLELYYPLQFVENEKVDFRKNGFVQMVNQYHCTGELENTHVVPRTIAGMLGEDIVLMDDGEGGLRTQNDHDLIAVINYETGVVALDYRLANKNLVLSYEYNLERVEYDC